MVVLLLILTGIFGWGLGWIAWGFSRAGGVVGWGLALGVVILLALTVWVTWREVLFGLAAARITRLYVGQHPDDGAPALTEPREEFEEARRAVSDGDEGWAARYRLACAYDALRDRRQARAWVRRAIERERSERTTARTA